MDDLLKDAIADAKAVRETALANAKVALEEAFTPRLKSMLSQKIQAEMEEEEDVEERMEDDEKDEAAHGDDEDPEERMKINADDEDPSDDHSEEMEPEDKEVEERGDDEVDESEIIEIDGVKYAPLKTEEEEEKDESVEEGEHEDKEDDVDEDLDLEAVLAELEADINEEEEDEKDESVSEGEHEDDEKKDESVNEEDEDDEKNEEVDEEVDHSSGIGSGDNKKGAADKSSGIGSVGKAKLKENEDVEEDVEEDIDLDEILSALSEEEEVEEQDNRVEELSKELEEHRDVVKYLRGKLNEVNLLNAKLLFSNKLFRAYGLNNEQKLKVVETFDRAANLREVKLVYSTLAESFGAKKNETVNESKGSASKAVASTQKPKEVIQEGSALRDRFKKLANIL